MASHYLGAHHGKRFDLCWVDFAGHDGGAGFVGRDGNFTNAGARTRREPTDVVRDLHQRDSQLLEGPACADEGVMGRERGELVRRRNEWLATQLADLGRDSIGVLGMCVQAGPDCGSPESQLPKLWHGRCHGL